MGTSSILSAEALTAFSLDCPEKVTSRVSPWQSNARADDTETVGVCLNFLSVYIQ